MIFSNILVPFDGSEPSIKSLQVALKFAQGDPNVKINVVHVVQLPLKKVPTSLYNQVKKMIYDEGEATIQHAKEITEDYANQVECYIKEGAPMHTILEVAEEKNCDCIIMGRRGLSGLKEFLGSVSHYVSQQAQIPVILIK